MTLPLLNVVIVDDEVNASEALSLMLQEYCPEVGPVSVAGSYEAACSLIPRLKPDLLFMDIQLGSKTGFDVLDVVKGTFGQLIFTTAYNEYALKAFRYSATDYLLKPVDPDLLAEVTKNAAALKKRSEMPVLDEQFLQKMAQMYNQPTAGNDKLFIPDQSGWYAIELKDVCYFKGKGSYTEIVTTQSQYTTSKTLRYFAFVVEEHPGFARLQKSYIVNSQYIRRIRKGAVWQVELANNTLIPVSERERDSLLELLRIRNKPI